MRTNKTTQKVFLFCFFPNLQRQRKQECSSLRVQRRGLQGGNDGLIARARALSKKKRKKGKRNYLSAWRGPETLQNERIEV